MLRRAFFLLIAVLGIADCSAERDAQHPAGYAFQSPAPNAPVLHDGNQTLNGAGGQKVALLVPVTGPRPELAQALVKAAQLALPDGGGPTLDVLDTGGTAAGAAAAAALAVQNGDRLILGPLTSVETASAAPIAVKAKISVLAFTNDASLNRPGVWTLGISSDQQIARLVSEARERGKTQFAALLPDTDFGRAMAKALNDALAQQGLASATIKTHLPGMAAITAAARELSDYSNRRGPIDARVKAARALNTTQGRQEAQELARSAIPPAPFDILLLADTGDDLQEIAAVLPYFDIDRSMVQIIGPALWGSQASGSAVVQGAWYAAPDNASRDDFDHAYLQINGAEPPPLADLAYDAAAIARLTITPEGFDGNALTQPRGFSGSDGWLSFSPGGQVLRSLAVFRVDHGGPTLIGAAAGAPGQAGL